MFIDSNFEKIKFLSPKISAFKLLRTHGYKNKENIKKKILESAEKALERLTYCSSPVGYFYIEEIKKKSLNRIQLDRTNCCLSRAWYFIKPGHSKYHKIS